MARAKVGDAYGITVEVEGEAGHLELLAAASAEFERLSGSLDKPRALAGAGFTTHLPAPRPAPAPVRRAPRAGP